MSSINKSRIGKVAVAVMLLLLPLAVYAQNSDPLVGTWNLTFSQNGTVHEIAVMTFNAGGTTVEYDTGGTNASASESIDLGKWVKTGDATYRAKEENYIYDSTGNLSALAIAKCHLTLASSQNSFKGGCAANFYECSLTKCPGNLKHGPVTLEVKGKRFR